MNKVLYIASEAFPLIKTGGLADVAGSLPVALLKQSQDVRLLLPAYPEVLKNISRFKTVATHSYFNLPFSIIETRLPGSKVIVWLVDCPAVFDRPGGPYTDQHGEAWADNALRFAILCHAAVDIALDKLKLNWKADIVHCNDWQTGLIPALLSRHEKRPATVFTIHNLAYQGNFDYQTFVDLHLPDELWHMHGLEFYNQLSFIKGGLVYADKINAVSPNYAKEILLPEFGYGQNGLLKSRQQDLSGIVNGIDEKHWNPGTDDLIIEKFNRRTLSKKVNNKTALQEQLSLPDNASIAMVGMVGRLVQQKGLDIILQSLKQLVQLELQIIILGTGDLHYEIQLSEWAAKYPDKIKVVIGYSEQLAHRIEAASDIYLMPSTFEPCGLNQLYSLRYGTLPIVTAVGGLADTITDTNKESIANKTANGFMMTEPTTEKLVLTMTRALAFFKDSNTWHQLQDNAMRFDSSWTASADGYIQLYKQALAKINKADS
ncbi:MAG: glycogen synthase GlgA [Gammaproteobacteria bacterium]|nr:glycogen synthase GlgA [Gammaproteobacteria bacterium]